MSSSSDTARSDLKAIAGYYARLAVAGIFFGSISMLIVALSPSLSNVVFWATILAAVAIGTYASFSEGQEAFWPGVLSRLGQSKGIDVGLQNALHSAEQRALAETALLRAESEFRYASLEEQHAKSFSELTRLVAEIGRTLEQRSSELRTEIHSLERLLRHQSSRDFLLPIHRGQEADQTQPIVLRYPLEKAKKTWSEHVAEWQKTLSEHLAEWQPQYKLFDIDSLWQPNLNRISDVWFRGRQAPRARETFERVVAIWLREASTDPAMATLWVEFLVALQAQRNPEVASDALRQALRSIRQRR